MSQHNGGRRVRQTLHHPSARPALERPSLFAGMDSESSVLDGDTQRVRILSTLEYTRQSTRMAPSKKLRIKLRLGKNWQLKALTGLMVTGVLTLLIAFALIVVNGHSGSGKSRDGSAESAQAAAPAKPSDTRLAAAIQAARSDRNNPLSALIATPAPNPDTVAARSPRPQAAVQAAVIENVALSPVAQAVAAAKLDAQLAAMPAAAPTSSRRVANHISAVISPASAAAAASSVRAIDARAYAVMTNAKAPTIKSAKPKNTKDEDVALLEAMFAHTGNRSTPAMSADEEIRTRCNVQSGAAAATCRAKVCVQNPSAAACHQDQ